MDKKELTLIVKATINPDDMEAFNNYISRLTELYAKVNAEQIGYFPVKEIFVGNDSPSFIAIYKFKGREALDSIYETEEYKNTMIALRDKGFKNLEVYLS